MKSKEAILSFHFNASETIIDDVAAATLRLTFPLKS